MPSSSPYRTDALPPGQHWIVAAARTLGLPTADDLDIAISTPVAEAWRIAATQVGITQHELVGPVAQRFRLEVADLATAEARARKLIPERIAREYGVFPVRETDRVIFVATADPADMAAEQAIGFAAGRRPTFLVASPDAIQDAIDHGYATQGDLDALLRASGAALDSVNLVADSGPEAISLQEVEAAPVVKLTNHILQDAVRAGASDIHIEPMREEGLVRVRVDGVMRPRMTLPVSVTSRVVSRIKVLGRLDIADRHRPQDGRARLEIDGRVMDLRISTVPTRHTEKAVIRILDPRRSVRLTDLQLDAEDSSRLRGLLAHRDGIVLVSGPTGSGKTTTLYAALRELADGDVNITTIEDPIEYELAGITQIQVDTKMGVTFASALRAILRQDPDVILVGEIRDAETAKTAVQAAMTGHLVLATVHANDAPSTVRRLLDLGVDSATVAGTLRGAIAQRLIRRVCATCHGTGVEGGAACGACTGSGMRGRVPVIEVLTVTAGVQSAISSNAPIDALTRAAAAGGMRPLRDAAMRRVAERLTTAEEVDRVIGRPAEVESSTDAAPVLLVDDDRVVRSLARAVLEKGGLKVYEASDGIEAFEVLGALARPPLIVLDLEMPRRDGRATLAALRADPRFAKTPVIMLTASGDPEVEAALMDAGADDYIGKPFQPAQFLARVRATLRRAALA